MLGLPEGSKGFKIASKCIGASCDATIVSADQNPAECGGCGSLSPLTYEGEGSDGTAVWGQFTCAKCGTVLKIQIQPQPEKTKACDGCGTSHWLEANR